MAKLGDERLCVICGGRAVLQRAHPSGLTLGWVDGHALPYDPEVVPVWQCKECEDRQPLDGELED
jgi:prepilin-type processing-associated H-X9-DG protein